VFHPVQHIAIDSSGVGGKMLDWLKCLQDLAAEDAATLSHLEAFIAWPADQEELFATVLKPQLKQLAGDPAHEDSIASAATQTWSKATAEINRVCDIQNMSISSICQGPQPAITGGLHAGMSEAGTFPLSHLCIEPR
jgi:hypothetical protein